MTEIDLIENRAARERLYDRTDVLNRVKELAQLPDTEHSSTAQVAAFYGVDMPLLRKVLERSRSELEANGYRVLSGSDLRKYRMSDKMSLIPSRGGSLAIWPRRAVLNVGMLLRDSEVARAVRTYLLEAEDYTRKATGADAGSPGRPVAAPALSVDALIAEISGRMSAQIIEKSVLPQLSALEERVRLLEAAPAAPAEAIVSNSPKKRSRDFVASSLDPLERVLEYIEYVTRRGARHCQASLDTYSKNVSLTPDAVEDALIRAAELGLLQQVGSTTNGHPVIKYFRRGF